ncbi:MAG: signal peptidase I, partial [Anaerotignaceae bacterium]
KLTRYYLFIFLVMIMKEHIKGWLEAIFEAMIIIAILYFVLFPVRVEGNSMAETLNEGDRVFVSRLMGTFGLYNTGDIVVFEKLENETPIKIVKRIIATEGDIVEIKDGKIYVNSVELQEDYISSPTDGELMVTVEEGHVFVLGDNREESTDSRFFGTINTKDVYAKVILRFLPISEIRAY